MKDRFLPEGEGIRVEVWVKDLEIPWSLLFPPDMRAFVSERPGRIRLIKKGRMSENPYITFPVAHGGEGGLMGLALFPTKPYLYAMYTYQEAGHLYNQVVRLKDHGEWGVLDKVIIDRIPGGKLHNGGRIVFGPDGFC